MTTKDRFVPFALIAGLILALLVPWTGATQASPSRDVNTDRGDGAHPLATQAVTWNTFLGSAEEDKGKALARDADGNLYAMIMRMSALQPRISLRIQWGRRYSQGWAAG